MYINAVVVLNLIITSYGKEFDMIIVGLDWSLFKHDFVIMNSEGKIIASSSAAGK